MPSSIYPEPPPTALTDHLTDASDSHDASAISIADAANDFTATEVEGALAELQAADEADEAALAAHLADATDVHAASAITFTPNGSIAATNVQTAIQEVRDEAAGGGAPSTVDYLVGTADGGLSAEIVVGTTPGGELGGTWASPTVDATHSGSTHSAASDTHVADTSSAHVASSIGFTPNGSISSTDVQAAIQEVRDEAAGGGAPSTVDYLVGTADGGLSGEIVVGTTPGGELGGTWASPTVDTVHSGSAHGAGLAAYAVSPNFNHIGPFSTNITLATNGGSLAIPVFIGGSGMALRRALVVNRDTASARAWRWDLYVDIGANTLNRVAASNGSESYTAAAISLRALNAASAPVALGPGNYWLVIQCTHATNNFLVGSTAQIAIMAFDGSQMKTTTNPNGATLDFVAATWTKQTSVIAVALQGDVFGSGAIF